MQNKPKSTQLTSQNDLVVNIWGSRGTLPTPGSDFLKYGGNTACVEVRTQSANIEGKLGTSLVFDAGTGIVPYGSSALKRGIKRFHLFLSHMHYDHIIGLTRFAPLFMPNTEINIYGTSKEGKSLKELFEQFFRFPFFPVNFSDLPCKNNLFFHDVGKTNCIFVDGCKVDIEGLNHPQGSLGFRIWDPSESVSVVYATDHEHGTEKDNQLIEFCQNTTLLIMDTTYCEENYDKHRGWGHSTAKAASEIALQAGVRKLGLFHHNPDSSDSVLESTILAEAMILYPQAFLCRENEPISLRDISENSTSKAS